MTNQFRLKNFFSAIAFLIVCSVSADAQETSNLKSRLAIVATETKTTIWVTDFPKQASVVLFDENDNLLSIVATNEYGAAYLSLPTSITATIYAKTMNGEINVSNKAAKTNSQQHSVASQSDGANTSTKA